MDLTGNQTILLVEDEIPIRMVCNRILKSKGYTVFEAENAKEGYEINPELIKLYTNRNNSI